MNTDFFEKLTECCKNSRENEPMNLHTTFKIGGPADFFSEPQDVTELKNIINLCKSENMPYMILGNGSNMLVSDKGIDGVVISMEDNFQNLHIEGNTVIADAGILLSTLSKRVYEKELTGMEFASGIPGTLGGAVYMNAGAYGGEMKDIVKTVTFIECDGNVVSYTADKLEFGYRKSCFSNTDRIILSVCIELKRGKKEEIKAMMADFTERRTTKQPISMPSAGSVFKRPEGYFAGTLIENAGLKGYSIGGAEVSEKHAGFIVNKGDATAEDVISLIEYIKQTVYEKYNVMLEPEVKITGRK